MTAISHMEIYDMIGSLHFEQFIMKDRWLEYVL